LAEKLGGEITEFFLPKDFGEMCCGCTKCFMESEDKCPHYQKLLPITKAIDEADVIILASPVYVFHATGAMKSFLHHYGYRWMVHRPEQSMFGKQGVCISTAAGAGMKSTNKDMADSLFYWGIAKIYRYGIPAAAVNWEGVSEKKKKAIYKATSSIASKIIRRNGKVKPGLKTRIIFSVMRMMQKNGFNPKDMEYWNEKGWTGKKRPWK
jgi:multimeric flavodoxin WrbA